MKKLFGIALAAGLSCSLAAMMTMPKIGMSELPAKAQADLQKKLAQLERDRNSLLQRISNPKHAAEAARIEAEISRLRKKLIVPGITRPGYMPRS